MKEPAYRLGRFLSLVDTLHLEYCKRVRKGDIPPQLLGNALIPLATSDPEKGLARMLERIRIYQAWAQKSDSGLARWALGQIGELTPPLADELKKLTRLDDAARAQLLLGYLAQSEKKQVAGEQDEGSN